MADLLPYPRFSIAERDRRWREIRTTMRERGIDVIVVPNDTGHSTDFQTNARYVSHVGGGALARACDFSKVIQHYVPRTRKRTQKEMSDGRW